MLGASEVLGEERTDILGFASFTICVQVDNYPDIGVS